MALGKKNKFDIGRIYKLIKDERYITNCQIKEEELEEIFNDYDNSLQNGQLESLKNEILHILNNKLPKEVHSIRGRVKDSDHLIEKIIRNSSDNEEKYCLINVDNYNKILTDLIGIRIIILDKRDWLKVHKCITKLFHNNPRYYAKTPQDLISDYDKYYRRANKEGAELKNSYHVEPPKVYITTEDDRTLYAAPDIDVQRSKTNYRSIHYIIRYKTVYFEIQVRTLFEEGWLEFDHKIKYPYDKSNIRKNEYIEILSSLAQTADKLISFYQEDDFKSYNRRRSRMPSGRNDRNNSPRKGGKSFEDRMNDEF